MKEGKTLLLTTHFMEESDALSDRIIIIANGNIKADGTSAKLKEQYGSGQIFLCFFFLSKNKSFISGYKLVINKQNGYHTDNIKNELYRYLPELQIETDISGGGGDVVFRTNQQPNDQFVQALHQLEIMKKENRIKNYGIQNSTMDDVFLKITKDTKIGNDSESTSVDIDRIGL
jgi:ATP-binding cassette subfamily A (ABC1) protein 3